MGEEFVGEKYMGEKPVGENLWMLLVILRFSVVSRFLAKVSVTCSWLEYLLAFVWDVAGAAICQTLDFSHTHNSLSHTATLTHTTLSHTHTLCVAGVVPMALGCLCWRAWVPLLFVWQAWHLVHSVWQAWHLVTSTSLCVAGVAIQIPKL